MIKNTNIKNSNNFGNYYTTNNFYYEKLTGKELIKKARICLKNKNYSRAYEYFMLALEENLEIEEIYYCYKNLLTLEEDLIEKSKYLKNIYSLHIKKSKKDIIKFLIIEIQIFIFEYKFFIILCLLAFIGKNFNKG